MLKNKTRREEKLKKKEKERNVHQMGCMNAREAKRVQTRPKQKV